MTKQTKHVSIYFSKHRSVSYITRVLAELDPHLDSLNLCNSIGSRTAKEIVTTIGALPKYLSSLNIRGNGIAKDKSLEELEDIMKAFSLLNLHTLNLEGNRFESRTGKELNHLFAYLSDKLVSLELGTLGIKTGREIEAILFALPRKNLRSLSMRLDQIDVSTEDEIKAIMYALPESLDTLELTLDGLGSNAVATFATIRSAMPSNLRTFRLELFGISSKSTAELEAMMHNLPDNLDLLNLTGNELGNRSAPELQAIIRAIPRSLPDLYLGCNNIGSLYTNAELKAIFSELPPCSKRLDLHLNSFKSYSEPELKEIFSILPLSVKELGLASIELGLMSIEKAKALIGALPKKLERLNLGGNDLDRLPISDQVALMRELPKKLRVLDLWGSNISVTAILALKGSKITQIRQNTVMESNPEFREMISYNSTIFKRFFDRRQIDAEPVVKNDHISCSSPGTSGSA